MSCLSKQACDVLECRIEAVLEDMSLTPLCDLPEEEAITVEKFLEMTDKTCKEASASIAKYVDNFCHLGFMEDNFMAILTHCVLVMPYGDIDVGQHWLR